MDKVTGDMMVRYTVAAESALAVLQQLLTACQAGQTAQNPAVVKATGKLAYCHCCVKQVVFMIMFCFC